LKRLKQSLEMIQFPRSILETWNIELVSEPRYLLQQQYNSRNKVFFRK